MHHKENSLIIGFALILLGIANLFLNFRLFFVESEIIFALFFGAAGVYFFRRFRRTQSWGALIFAAIFAFLGAAILVNTTHLALHDFLGLLFFWELSALFFYGFVREQNQWGWLIPAGVTFTFGIMVLINMLPYRYHDLAGGLFFLGIGLTFTLLYFIRNEKNGLDWAKIPALILVIFSGFVFLNTADAWLSSLLMPLTVIVWGGYLIYRSSQSNLVKKTIN